jgi:hypothetical protein
MNNPTRAVKIPPRFDRTVYVACTYTSDLSTRATCLWERVEALDGSYLVELIYE